MQVTEAQAKLVLDVLREYRVTRDEMSSPLNPRRATHIQFVMFCNDRAHAFWKLLPAITFDETMELYLLASKTRPGFRADRVWADYTVADQEALTELLGLLLGILRQQRSD